MSGFSRHKLCVCMEVLISTVVPSYCVLSQECGNDSTRGASLGRRHEPMFAGDAKVRLPLV